MKKFCVMEYLYRDAGNYKVFGEILLTGTISETDSATILGKLDSGEFFVAEQVGVPPLSESLWSLSGGMTEHDHALHEFIGFRDADDEDILSLSIWGSAKELVYRFHSIGSQWDCSKSLYYQ